VPANDAITPHAFLRTKKPAPKKGKKTKEQRSKPSFSFALPFPSQPQQQQQRQERRDAYPAAAEDAGHNLKNAEAPRHENR
jgi:hypothetical protein